MNQKKPEILAPAGSAEGLRAAIAAGADAVYIGGSRFGARAYAKSTQADSLLSAVDYAHVRGRRVYLTVNTLVKEREFGELYEFMRTYYEGGIDAAIVQDMGVLHFLAAQFPGLPIHASTQMTIVSGDGAAMLARYPVTRLIPARELSLAEIKQLRKSTPLEIETFVHGALCYCYSGQCLFSSMLGGRSGNRGRCAQPCRMPYTLLSDGKAVREGAYLLSLKDMCTLEKLPQLILAGIDSFKIEGRMKSLEYAAGVTAAYRKLTDLYFEYGEGEFMTYLKNHPGLLKEQTERVSDLYNRGGFTDGYYFHYHGPGMMSMERPNHSGLLIGEVASVKKGAANIRLYAAVRPQDVLEIRTPYGESYEFTVGKEGAERASQIPMSHTSQGCYETNVRKGFPLAVGLPVYRTKNETLRKELYEAYGKHPMQSPVKGVFTAMQGEPARLTLSVKKRNAAAAWKEREEAEEITVTAVGGMVTAAKTHPVTKERIKEQLRKTGESEFCFEELSVQVGEQSFLPMGMVNELRREAFARLADEVRKSYQRTLPALWQDLWLNPDGTESLQTIEDTGTPKRLEGCNPIKNCQPAGKPELVCLVSEKEQWDAVMEAAEVSAVYLDLQNEPLAGQLALARQTEAQGKRAFLVLPHLFRLKERARYAQAEGEFFGGGFSGVLAKSLEELAFLKEQAWAEPMEIRLNHNLYVLNREAKSFFLEQGYARFTAPLELNQEELETLGIRDCDFLMYGRIPLMVSAQCVRDNVLACAHGATTDGLVLSDRFGAGFPVRQICTFCYNIIYNSVCLSLLGQQDEIERLHPMAYRLDFTLESKKETKRVLRAFFAGEALPADTKEGYTKGHWKRGVE